MQCYSRNFEKKLCSVNEDCICGQCNLEQGYCASCSVEQTSQNIINCYTKLLNNTNICKKKTLIIPKLLILHYFYLVIRAINDLNITDNTFDSFFKIFTEKTLSSLCFNSFNIPIGTDASTCLESGYCIGNTFDFQEEGKCLTNLPGTCEVCDDEGF